MRIEGLFDGLVQAHLTIKLSKCEFVKATMTYLGTVVGQGEVHPIHAKVAFQFPTTKWEELCFLRMAGYYCRFCANFAPVGAPLTELLKAYVKYVWPPTCQQAFD